MSSEKFSIEDIRRIGQPEAVISRRSGEHWAGSLYMRRLSPYVTSLALRLGLTPNSLTYLMILAGLAGAFAFSFPGLPGAMVGVLLVQTHLLFDCSDGELARVSKNTSPAGIYLDRLGHYIVDAALFIAYGVRSGSGTGYLILGAIGGVVALLAKAAGDLITVARAQSGLATAPDTEPEEAAGWSAGRRLAERAPLHRLPGAIESSLVMLLAAIVDLWIVDEQATRVALILLVAVAVAIIPLRVLSNVSSSRLK